MLSDATKIAILKSAPKLSHIELIELVAEECRLATQRKPLTDGQIWDLHIKMSVALDCKLSDLIEMTRAIEAAHGIKE